MIKIVKRHYHFILFYGLMYLAFLWPLLFFGKTFIFGDFWQQHYPWAYVYSLHIKSWKLPYWVSGMACGFPLVAEGQIGAYYLFNMLSYLVLPFSMAYSFGISFHVFFGGFGFYKYGQKIGLSKEAASLGAVLFSFGSGYGGCFSNTAGLRTLSWLPWALLIWQNFISEKSRRRYFWLSLLGVAFSQMWTAGSPQLALYGVGYIFCLCMIQERGKGLLGFIAASCLSFLLSFPQWVATYELVNVSVRSSETASFALWGSVLPPAVISLVFPKWGVFAGISFYLGAASTLLFLVTWLSKKNKFEKAHLYAVFLFIFLSFGKYNPLYFFVIEKFSLTAIRNPSKFIFFSIVSMSVVASFGFDHLGRSPANKKFVSRFKKYLLTMLVLIGLFPLFAKILRARFGSFFLRFANQTATQVFSQKKDPMHSIAYYQARASLIYNDMGKLFQYTDPWNLWAILIFIVSALVLMKILKNGAHEFWKRVALPAVLLVDLLVFGIFFGGGFTGNIRDFPRQLPQTMIDVIRTRQSLDSSNLIEGAVNPDNEILPPNSNLLYSISGAGGYSPLLVKRYYELSKNLGISDCSLGRRAYSDEIWMSEFGLIEALGVGEILSDKKISLEGVSLVAHTDRDFLYALNHVLPLVYAVYDWKTISDEPERLAYLKGPTFHPFQEVVIENQTKDSMSRKDLLLNEAKIISKTDTEVIATIDVRREAFLVFRSVFYPRWKVEIDGKSGRLIPANHAFSGVFIKNGTHHIRFFYDDGPQKTSEMISLIGWIILCFSNLLLLRSKKI